MKWPENYKERIESIIGAKADSTNTVYFLGYNFSTVKDANNCLADIQLIQRQLRQVRSEINTKIKILKRDRPRGNNSDWGKLIALSSFISDLGSGSIYNYQNVVLTINKLLDACEMKKNNILIWITDQKQYSLGESLNRERISDEVQVFVWNRDGGKCVKCGSQENLEYDHIIPISKGGSNTARNIQLLCEKCNHSKGANIGS